MTMYRFYVSAGATAPAIDNCTIDGVQHASNVVFKRDIGALDPFGNHIYEYELDDAALTGNKTATISANAAFRAWQSPNAAKTASSNLQPLTTDSTVVLKYLTKYRQYFYLQLGEALTSITASTTKASGGWDLGTEWLQNLEYIGNGSSASAVNTYNNSDVYFTYAYAGVDGAASLSSISAVIGTTNNSLWSSFGSTNDYLPPNNQPNVLKTLSAFIDSAVKFPVYNKYVTLPVGYAGGVDAIAAVSESGYPISYSVDTFSATGISINSATGELTVNTPLPDANPRQVVVMAYTATDNRSAKAVYFINLQAPVANQAPTVAQSNISLLPVGAGNTGVLARMPAYFTDPEGGVLTYAINGGADAALFAVDAAGDLTFTSAPTTGGIKTVVVRATDAQGAFVDLTINIEVSMNPVFVSVAAVDFAENASSLLAYTAVATDGDGDTLTYSVSGADAAKFAINAATGALSWVSQPDFETPASAASSNVYSVTVSANDGVNTVDHPITITVTNASEADTQTSIDTGAVAQMLGGELTIDGVAAVVSALAVAADAADVANKAELQNQIDAVETAVEAAQLAADRLEAYEKGQIETLLTQLVETDGFQALLETATVTINGNERTVASILQAIAEAPVVVGWKRTTDTNGVMNGVIATLATGEAVTFAKAVEVIDATTEKHTFSVADFAGTGIAKSFYMVMRAKEVAFGGLFGGRLVNATLGWHLDETSNMLFDIVGTAGGGASGTVEVPDYNADGVTGNVTP